MRLSIDVGGTFTDILLTSSGGRAEAFKASTTYPDPIEGIVAGLELAAASRGFSVEKLLGETESLRAIRIFYSFARVGEPIRSTTKFLIRRAIFHALSLLRFQSACAPTAVSTKRLTRRQRCG